MKRYFIIPLLFLATASFAVAQSGAAPATDVLGAHLNYGRGCAACHAPHSGAQGNGALKTADPTTGNVALWGQDVGSLYNQTITTAGGTVEKLPGSFAATTGDVSGLLTCLSCHDGNYATGAMMKNKIVESLPTTYGTYDTPPTLLGNDGTGAGNYLNDHPVGTNAVFGCNSATQTHDWDCTLSTSTSSSGTVSPVITAGPNMAAFINKYGFFVSLASDAGTPIVVCTSCHNQHLMNVVAVNNTTGFASGAVAKSGTSGLPAGNYYTMFFIRAPYNPGDTSATNNQTAQFCRQCHGGESNEMNGGTAGTTF